MPCFLAKEQTDGPERCCYPIVIGRPGKSFRLNQRNDSFAWRRGSYQDSGLYLMVPIGWVSPLNVRAEREGSAYDEAGPWEAAFARSLFFYTCLL